MPESTQVQLKQAIEIARRIDIKTLHNLIDILDQKRQFAEYCAEGVVRPHINIELMMRAYDDKIKLILGIL